MLQVLQKTSSTGNTFETEVAPCVRLVDLEQRNNFPGTLEKEPSRSGDFSPALVDRRRVSQWSQHHQTPRNPPRERQTHAKNSHLLLRAGPEANVAHHLPTPVRLTLPFTSPGTPPGAHCGLDKLHHVHHSNHESSLILIYHRQVKILILVHLPRPTQNECTDNGDEVYTRQIGLTLSPSPGTSGISEIIPI